MSARFWELNLNGMEGLLWGLWRCYRGEMVSMKRWQTRRPRDEFLVGLDEEAIGTLTTASASLRICKPVVNSLHCRLEDWGTIQRLCRAIEGTIFSVIVWRLQGCRFSFLWGEVRSSTLCWAFLSLDQSTLADFTSGLKKQFITAISIILIRRWFNGIISHIQRIYLYAHYFIKAFTALEAYIHSNEVFCFH